VAFKRKPLIFEGDIILLSGNFLQHIAQLAPRFEVLGVVEAPDGSKVLEVRKAESHEKKAPK